jgi:hypothetical protein
MKAENSNIANFLGKRNPWKRQNFLKDFLRKDCIYL